MGSKQVVRGSAHPTGSPCRQVRIIQTVLQLWAAKELRKQPAGVTVDEKVRLLHI